jgi:hypothetical protein
LTIILTIIRAERQSLQAAKPCPQEPIGCGQSRPLYGTMQDAELVAKSEILHLEGGSRFEACQGDGDR